MAKHTPDNPARPRPDADTADPHRAAPAPPPMEGMRPEADAALVRPEADEPMGPAAGLFHAAAVEATQEAPLDTPRADAQAAYLGIEEEGVESSQVFGLMLATVAAVICLILALYFIFYLPKLSDTEGSAEDVPEERRLEQRELRAEAEERLGQYATSADDAGRYRIPIDAAMQQTAGAYGAADSAATAGGGTGGGNGLATRADFNLSWIQLQPPAAVGVLPSGAPAEGASEEVLDPMLPGVEASTAAPAAEEGAAPAPSIPEPEQ